MIRTKNRYTNFMLLVALVFTVISCERGLSDEAEFATYASTGEIFTEDFVGMGTNFFFPFVGDGAKPDVFSVDETLGYESTTSIKIEVPDATDPEGNFAGFSFVVDGSPRDLSSFDALTFWARSSQSANIGVVGFGENKFEVLERNVRFTTRWTKFTVPIPDASKLDAEKGMLIISAGGIGDVVGEEVGYTFWLDEIKFEKLGTLGQAQPSILGGIDVEQVSFPESTIGIGNLSQTFNTANGTNVTTVVAPSYFTFSSSDNNIAQVSELGVVSVISEGQAVITAVLDGVLAKGSLTINVGAGFLSAPTPPVRDAANVISFFSEAYTNINNLNLAVFNNSDIQIQSPTFNGDQIINYENLGFVGIGGDGTSDVSGLSFLHLDVQLTSASGTLIVELLDFGTDQSIDGSDDTAGGSNVSSQLIEGTWVGIDIPINGFTQATGGGGAGSPNLNNIGVVTLVSNGGSVLVDNIYFYQE